MEEINSMDQTKPRTLNVGDTYLYMGYELTATKRTGDIVLAEHPEYGIEVFKILHNKAGEICGRATVGGEFPPSTSQWGIKPSGHWRFSDHTLADAFFNSLVRTEETPTVQPGVKRTLQVGDFYLHKNQRIDVQERVGDIVLCGNASYGWEVFKIQHHKGDELPQITSKWGMSSGYWHYDQKAKAEKYFKELIQEANKPARTKFRLSI